jgi:hypothetical protein
MKDVAFYLMALLMIAAILRDGKVGKTVGCAGSSCMCLQDSCAAAEYGACCMAVQQWCGGGRNLPPRAVAVYSHCIVLEHAL